MIHHLKINDVFKQYTLDQDKIMPPEQTVAVMKNRLERLNLRILEKTVRIDNGRLDIPVYFSICGPDAMAVTGTKKQMGKGATPQQAEASAVMELAERFSFFSFCNQPENFITDRYRNLKKEALPFDMIAKSVHDDRREQETARKIFENVEQKWTWGFHLARKEKVLIPFDWFYTINEFNGPSAGNCAEEALLQGICEIVERHVSALVSQGKLPVPGIRPESATDAMVVEMLGKYRQAGIRLFVSDLTLDMGIPTISVLAYDPATFPARSEIIWTAGTTPNPQKALSRALTEVAQLAGDFNTEANYVASGLPKFVRLDEARYITDPVSYRSIHELPDLSDNNLRVEIENCLAALSGKGMEVLVIDTTHPDLQIPAFYTIIPGAHFRERAVGTSVGMFSAKIVTEKNPPETALAELKKMEQLLPDKYYLKFYQGVCLLQMEKQDQALACFQEAMALEPNEQDKASIYSYMGVCLKEMGAYHDALDVLAKGAGLDPERTDIHNLMGFCFFKLKKHQEAIDCFQKVLRLNPDSAIDYANIGSNYRELGDRNKALRYYAMALELDPTIEFARENLEKLKG
ncbi:MAG: YcaO-like family protein [Thermodesulfobacteriota bacterium]